MRLIVDKVLWGTLLLLFGPTAMIVASWNALPGEGLYGVKLALERTALAVASPSYATAGTLQIKYTERRYAEAKQLLASKQSVQGLPYLEQQIAETKKAIERAPNKQAQVTLAKQYISALNTVSGDLEVQKQTVTSSSKALAYMPPQSNRNEPSTVPPPTQQQTTSARPSPTSDVKEVPTSEVKKPPTSTPTSTPTPIQMAQVSTNAPITTQQAVAALQIDQTRQNVSQTIADLQELIDDENHGNENSRGRSEQMRSERNNGNHRGQESNSSVS